MVCIVGNMNGTRCWDGVKVLWCHSHLPSLHALVSIQKTFVTCSFSAYETMNRLSACREFCGVHSWQNGTRCRDDVKVLWCYM